MTISTIAVLGAGTMGRGIAYAAALGGYRTILEDVAPQVLEAGLAWIHKALDEGVAREKVTPQQKDSTLANFSSASSVEAACKAADRHNEGLRETIEREAEQNAGLRARDERKRLLGTPWTTVPANITQES